MKSEICKKCADKSCYGYDHRITECEDFQPMTNYDRLISKTQEELAEYLSSICYDFWKIFVADPKKMWLAWLKSPANARRQLTGLRNYSNCKRQRPD